MLYSLSRARFLGLHDENAQILSRTLDNVDARNGFTQRVSHNYKWPHSDLLQRLKPFRFSVLLSVLRSVPVPDGEPQDPNIKPTGPIVITLRPLWPNVD